MLSADILNTIECAVPHICAKELKESNHCAHCQIGYEFIVTEPKSLRCGHNICSECEAK